MRDPPTRRLRRAGRVVLEEGVCGSAPRLRAQPQCRPVASRRSVRRCSRGSRKSACRRGPRRIETRVTRVRLRRKYVRTSDPFARCRPSTTQGQEAEALPPHAGLIFCKNLPAFESGAIQRLEKLRAVQPKPLRITQDLQTLRSPLYYQVRGKSGKTTEQRFQNRMRARGGKCLEPEWRDSRRAVAQPREEDDAVSVLAYPAGASGR